MTPQEIAQQEHFDYVIKMVNTRVERNLSQKDFRKREALKRVQEEKKQEARRIKRSKEQVSKSFWALVLGFVLYHVVLFFWG